MNEQGEPPESPDTVACQPAAASRKKRSLAVLLLASGIGCLTAAIVMMLNVAIVWATYVTAHPRYDQILAARVILFTTTLLFEIVLIYGAFLAVATARRWVLVWFVPSAILYSLLCLGLSALLLTAYLAMFGGMSGWQAASFYMGIVVSGGCWVVVMTNYQRLKMPEEGEKSDTSDAGSEQAEEVAAAEMA